MLEKWRQEDWNTLINIFHKCFKRYLLFLATILLYINIYLLILWLQTFSCKKNDPSRISYGSQSRSDKQIWPRPFLLSTLRKCLNSIDDCSKSIADLEEISLNGKTSTYPTFRRKYVTVELLHADKHWFIKMLLYYDIARFQPCIDATFTQTEFQWTGRQRSRTCSRCRSSFHGDDTQCRIGIVVVGKTLLACVLRVYFVEIRSLFWLILWTYEASVIRFSNARNLKLKPEPKCMIQ